MTLVYGFDAARYQGAIDYGLLRAQARRTAFGVFGMAEWRVDGSGPGRITAGAGALDAQVERNLALCARAGIVPGLYQRADPTAAAPEQEAAGFVARIGALGGWGRGMLIPAIDIEPTGDGVADAEVNWAMWVREFIAAYRDLAPIKALRYYSSGSYFTKMYGGVTDLPAEVQLWVGHSEKYSSPPGQTAEQWAGRTAYTFEGRTRMHQYTTTGTLPGITGNVDLDCLMSGVRLRDVMQGGQ